MLKNSKIQLKFMNKVKFNLYKNLIKKNNFILNLFILLMIFFKIKFNFDVFKKFNKQHKIKENI